MAALGLGGVAAACSKQAHPGGVRQNVGAAIPAAQAEQPSSKGFELSEAGRRKVSSSVYVARPPGGKPTPQREPSIDQEALLAGKYTLGHVLEAGQNQFNLPFTQAHGHGEGPQGPRHRQRAVFNSRGGVASAPAAWPFLRVNGLDSQSCYECHSSIGQFVPKGAKTTAEVRKPGAQGGPAGVGNTAFINDQFPEELGQLLISDPKTKAVLTKFARNPPHVFGTGYTQRLATEMTTELWAQAEAVREIGRRQPNTKVSMALQAKGVEFGSFSTTCSSADRCTDDTSAVQGVQTDLVVRPFQWGGIASSVRHFARDALDFHFSVQAVEKVGHKDCDLDGLKDEITVGNVTALTAYVAMFRPPTRVTPKGKERVVSRGAKLLESVGCTSCHRASLDIEDAVLTVMTPPTVPESAACPEEVATLGNSLAHPSEVVTEADTRVQAALRSSAATAVMSQPEATPAQLYQAMRGSLHSRDVKAVGEGNYQVDLSLTKVRKKDVPAYVWPRLPSANHGVEVPLYSDLKLHYMGEKLSDEYPQGTDTAGYAAQPGYYVTRVLWGVGDSDPYMHDGRARTLKDAIQLHGVEGSEAKAAAEAYEKLDEKDRESLLAYLQSLRLPIAEGTQVAEYVP